MYPARFLASDTTGAVRVFTRDLDICGGESNSGGEPWIFLN